MTTRKKWDVRQARNLIDTLGPWQGLHVAKQFGWCGAAREIESRLGTRAFVANGRPSLARFH